MSEGDYSEKKKSKVKSSRRAKKVKDSTDDLGSSTISLSSHPLSQSLQTPRDYRDDRLKEASIRRDLLAEHLQIEEALSTSEDEATLASLEVPAAEARALRERPYSGAAAMAGFRGLERWARDLNLPVASCPEPEIVLVGPAGEGKTSVLGALLGIPIRAGGEGTKRPFVYHVSGDVTATLESEKVNGKDRVIIRRDAFLAEFAKESILENGSIDLPAEIDRRNKATEEPVDIDLALPGHVRMTLIDTPGFLLDPEAEGAALAEAALKAAIAPSNRLIVVVRRAVDVSGAACGDYLMDLVRQADPTLARTVAVYTHLSTYLQTSAATQNPKAAARFLSGASTLPSTGNNAAAAAGAGAPSSGSSSSSSSSSTTLGISLSEGRIFFASFPSLEKSTSSDAPTLENPNEAFASKVYRYALRDIRSVEGLQCDPQLIGAHNFARCVFTYAWRVHQASAPRVLAALRARRASHAARHAAVREQRERLASPALFRVRAAAYTAAFLRRLRALVAGSACANPALCGQTSAEERAAAAANGAWADAEGRALAVRYAEWGVPNWQSKVYGGQQLERLLAEFAALCSHVTGDVITDDDVIIAIGTPALGGGNGGSYRVRAEAACALACRRAEGALAPLIAQLCERATYVMKRLAPIAARLISECDDLKMSTLKNEGLEEVKEDSRFVHFVCERYAALIDAEGARCAEMCAQEFHSVGAVCFAMVEEVPRGSEEEEEEEEENGEKEAVAAVREMEGRVFEKIRERVVRNVVLRVYNGLVVPMEGELWAGLQKEVGEIGDEAVEGLFEAQRMKGELE